MILSPEFPLMPEEKHAMAAEPSIDPALLAGEFFTQQLASASPDLLRQLLEGLNVGDGGVVLYGPLAGLIIQQRPGRVTKIV